LIGFDIVTVIGIFAFGLRTIG